MYVWTILHCIVLPRPMLCWQAHANWRSAESHAVHASLRNPVLKAMLILKLNPMLGPMLYPMLLLLQSLDAQQHMYPKG